MHWLKFVTQQAASLLHTPLCQECGVRKVTCNETLTTNYNKEHECIFVQKHSVESIKQILQN